MEKAILRTFIYADIFDYPLKIEEIQKWLVSKKADFIQVEKALKKLVGRLQVTGYREFYCLPRRKKIIGIRKRREKQSQIYFKKAKILSWVLKLVPWIKLVGVSGGLAMNNAGKSDDIDLFIITGEKRLWISRFLALGLLSLTGQRRKVGEEGRNIAGKICINTILERGCLEQRNKDIFIAHEVLQMRVLWQREEVYSKYLSDNNWAFRFLPNWVVSNLSLRGVKRRSNLPHQMGRLPRSLWSLAMTGVENIAKWGQLKIMQKPKGMERIEEGALYFHPEDCRKEVLGRYMQKLKRINMVQ